MNIATFRALTNYDTPAAGLAANPNNGDTWLLNATHIFQDGTMGNPAPNASAKKNPRQQQFAKAALNVTTTRNKGTASQEGYQKNSLTDAANKETVVVSKGPMVRSKIQYQVTDSNAPGGYRTVYDLLEDPTSTSPYRDDDNQVRK